MSVRFGKCGWLGCRRETRNGACPVHGYEPDDPEGRDAWGKKCASIDSQMRAQAMRERELADVRSIQGERASAQQCIMCGSGLSWLDKIMRRQQHKNCVEFTE